VVDLRTKIAGKSLRPVKILVIGNYPPPMCGWAMQTYLVTAELRGRGQVCDVLKINENRMVRSPDHVDVQNAWDYLAKIVRFALCGYRLNVHVNAMSKKGYLLALVAAMIGRLTFRPVVLTFHGGPPQDYFPRPDSWRYHQAFHLLFRSARRIACDSLEIKQAMESYGIKPQKIAYIDFCLGGEVYFHAPKMPEKYRLGQRYRTGGRASHTFAVFECAGRHLYAGPFTRRARWRSCSSMSSTCLITTSWSLNTALIWRSAPMACR